MRKGLLFSIALFLFSCIFLNSCTKSPVYPDTPEIEYHSMTRYSSGDSVIISINFKDGDGDLGIKAEETNPPYHELEYVRDNSGNFVKLGSSPSLPPYNCFDYVDGEFDGVAGRDTVQVKLNPNYNNFLIDFYVKQPDQSYLKFDFTPFCTNYNGRFPLLNTSGTKGPIEGTLSYTVKDIAALGLAGMTVKFRIQIKDRAFRKSNIIDTPDIVID